MAIADVGGQEDEEEAIREYIATMTERQGAFNVAASRTGSSSASMDQRSVEKDGARKSSLTAQLDTRTASPKGRKLSNASPRPNLFANVSKGIAKFMQRRRAEPQNSPRSLDDPFAPVPTAGDAWGAEDMSQLVQLYGYEALPEARRIREMLCTLEIPYVVHNVAKGSDKALPHACIDEDGYRTLPWFVDPATGFESGEVPAILSYLSDAHCTGRIEEEWLALTAFRYWRQVAMEFIQWLLIASLDECRIFTQHLIQKLKYELMPAIREEVTWSVKETALNIGLANGTDSAQGQRTAASPMAGSSRQRSRSRGPATPNRGTSPAHRSGRGSISSPPGTPRVGR